MQHGHQLVPVTALAFFSDDYILSGEGTYLHVYQTDSTVHKRIRIFEAQAIHGIVVLENGKHSSFAIIWGGPLVRIVLLNTTNGSLDVVLGLVDSAEDWILDAAFAPSQQPLIGLVTAHSALSTISIPQRSDSETNVSGLILESRVLGSNCILYSAHITWLSASHCLIASGTAFGDIVVWSADLDDHSCLSAPGQTHFSFSAHEGSVFGVRLSAQLSIPGFDCERVLVSCSDDRTVRVWDLSHLDQENYASGQDHRDTGFGAKSATATCAPPCLAKAMGHISRIWHVRFTEAGGKGEAMRILSFGEDASVILWALKVEDSSFALTQVHTTKAHSGKNVWSVAMAPRPDRFVTGGADGAIALYDRPQHALHIQRISSPPTKTQRDGDNFRAYDFMHQDVLLSTTDRGRVALIHLSACGEPATVTEISPSLSDLRGYSIVATVPSLAFAGGTNGTMYRFSSSIQQLSRFAQINGKVAGLFPHLNQPGSVSLLATAVNTSVAQLFTPVISDQQSQPDVPATALSIGLPSSFIVTSFAHHEAGNHNYAVLGSRGGSIAIYDYSYKLLTGASSRKLCREVHGKEAVTALQWVHHANSPGKDLLLTTGRDGTIAVHEIHLLESGLDMIQIHQLLLPFGPNIEGLHILNDDRVLVSGFKSKHFVVYDIQSQREIMSVECGGAHRNWAFQPHVDGGQFVWTKASNIFQATQASLPYTIVKPGGHGREIKAVAISSDLIIATGAEDTNIRLFTVRDGGFDCLQTLRKHNTGIQHLAWHGSYLFSSGGFEEFFVWRVRSNIPILGVAVACESVHPRSGSSDLRITGFNVQGGDDEQGSLITIAYSDSTVKTWKYCNRAWELVATGNYLTSCLTHVLRVGGQLVTAATDGHIATWTWDGASSKLHWTQRYKVHQSAIHAITCLDLDDATSLLLTGGDDNAIAITRVDGHGAVLDKLVVRNAHAAAVTGLAGLRRRRLGKCWFASASIDQRTKVWEVDLDAARLGVNGGMAARKVFDVFTAVADVSSLELYTSDADDSPRLLVCGVGMEMWRVADSGDGAYAEWNGTE